MSGFLRNVANNMLFTCISFILLFIVTIFHQTLALASLEPLVPNDNLPTTADSSISNNMASEARGAIDRIDTISNLLPHPTNFLLDNIVSTAGSTGIVTSVNLTRQHDGDIFWTNGVKSCNMDTCVGLSSGTAAWLAKGVHKMGSLSDTTSGSKSQLEILLRQAQHKQKDKLSPLAAASTAGTNVNGESCQCRCLPYLNTYREDLGICVDDIHECTLSPFVSGSSSEKIPFVFLPLRGQIIYPSREISFAHIRIPVCAVTGAQYLTANGWSDLRNPIDTDYPFRIFRDEGRTFLQWLGEADLRHKMQGRLIVVHLVCRDMTLSLNASISNDQLVSPKNVFSPCVAFRVNGSPVKYANNISEVLFQAETTATLAATSDGMSTKEYIVIGVCSLLLGLIYVSSVFLYLHMKKRKNRDQNRNRNSLDDLNNEINYPKNDQVTFGAPFTRSGSLYSAGSIATSNEPRSRASLSSMKEEMGIVKNNPLLQHFPQLNDHHSGFTSDISNSNSECEMDGGNYHDKVKQMQTNALVHPQTGMMMHNGNGNGNSSPKGSHHSSNNGAQSQGSKDDDNVDDNSSSQETECLPTENVSIIEEMMTEEKLENLRAMVNGNIRRKLYFNPAYFEPHLLAQPPPAALEFLQKIREVIAIAKYKMATKRYQPSLTLIPEEGSPRSNTPSVYGSQMPTPSEYQGCVTNRCSGHVKNCGDKRNSIEKWLEMVQSTEDNRASEENRPPGNQQNEAQRQSPSSSSTTSKSSEDVKTPNSIRSGTSGSKRIAPPKQKPPPPPVQQKSAITHNPRNISNQQRQEDEESHYGHNPSSLYQKSRNIPSLPALQQKLDAYSALTASAHMYGYAETGSEIYNNPKFTLHDSPAASQRSRGSSHRSRKRLDVLDHYAAASTPTSLSSTERAHYNMLRSMEQWNDHLDSGTLERMHQEYTDTLRSNGSFNLDIPTPDYDSTMEKKIKDIYNNTQSSGPSVPTPDYSSLSRKSLKQYQPDSPIYRRKSPQYLIVDYETDSLERLEATKRKSSQSSSSPSSDVSSQLSPSLSTALPLEEELEISHTVYQGSGYNTKSLKSEKKNTIKTLDSGGLKKDVAARIKYDTPFRGSMTIEVEHEPPSDLERSTDSDQYEPDTLDRKPKKQSFCDVNPWTNMEMKRSFDNLSSPPQSLPDMSKRSATTKVESQNSFRLKPHGTPGSTACRRQISGDSAYESQVELRRPCGNEDLLEDPNTKVSNLRDIYQSLLVRQNSDCSCKCGGQATSMFLQEKIEELSEKGRILTLEAKHTRRQRCSQPATPPPMVEISNESSNKCTIKISTPKAGRVNVQADKRPTEYVEPRVHQKPTKEENPAPAKNSPRQLRSLSETPPSRIKRSLSQSPQTPPPPPPPTSASTTLNSHTSRASSNTQHQSYRANSHTEEETMSNHSESTEVTGISGTMTNSEFGGTIDKKASPNHNKLNKSDKSLEKSKVENINSLKSSITPEKTEAQQTAKMLKEEDFGAIFNTHINGLRNDYSLNKYLNRRKSQERNEVPSNDSKDSSNQPLEMQMEHNNNLKFNNETDVNKLDVVSLSSRSNRSSSRLSDRTKEMYRNAGVPVGIAYPQRSNANNNNNSSSSAHNSNSNNPATPPSPPTNNVQTVYRCEIEPVQLTHGMQIAMGLKDRPKKAKDIKNAWKKFVSMAASKFSPTQSPAPPFDKKASSLLEVLERDEGISSLIEDHPQVSTPKSSYSAPASQNYYEQRFGPRTQELDSGYMSADSGEAYKRSFYDRYNFKMMSERDHIIRVSTIEDNSDGDSTLTDRHKGEEPSTRRGSILDATRFEDIEHINEQQLQQCLPEVSKVVEVNDDVSDNDSEKTLTRSNVQRRSPTQSTSSTTFTSDEDEEEPITTSYGSSETDGETNVDDMWESGAESVETHSVLYKNVRKSIER